jgi:Ca-activated chloride channel family protein
MPRSFIRLLFLLIVTGSLVYAQESLYTLKVDVPVVSVDVTVTDASGNPVNSLEKDDFVVLENGVPQEVRFFSPSSAPYNVLLLFDASGSTQHKWVFMQRAILAFMANLRPQDDIAIGTFGYELHTHVRWADSLRRAVDLLPGLTTVEPAGGTNLYQSLEDALKREFRSVTTRRAVMVLTDGRDTSLYMQAVSRNRLPAAESDRDFQRLFRVAREQRIPIYFAALNTDRNLEPNTSGGDEHRNLRRIFPNSDIASRFLIEVRNRMELLADVSGGTVLFPTSIDDIVPMYERIGRELGLSYTLAYIPNITKTAESWRQIEVRHRLGGYKITQSRSGYNARQVE